MNRSTPYNPFDGDYSPAKKVFHQAYLATLNRSWSPENSTIMDRPAPFNPFSKDGTPTKPLVEEVLTTYNRGLNMTALYLKLLHQQPGDPIVFTNVYNLASATAIITLDAIFQTSPPLVKAIATTSYGIASSWAGRGVPDEELTLEQNLGSLGEIARKVTKKVDMPLTVDLQDGYGPRLAEAIQGIISMNVTGANIEDSYPVAGFKKGFICLRSLEQAADRIRAVISVAKQHGVEDFVVNARTDVMRLNPIPEGWNRNLLLAEAVRRGKAYLKAGATCIFVWGGAAGNITTTEVKILVHAFQGRLAVKLASGEDALSV